MKNIAIYGFGGLGREVACLINSVNDVNPEWNIIGYIDDGVAVGTSNRYGSVIGDVNFLNNYTDELYIVFAIGNPQILRFIYSQINNPKIVFPNIIAPDVLFFDKNSVEMGIGNLITFSCRISCDVRIGNFNILNGAISLGHDVQIGDYNVFNPSSRVSGQCKIGNSNFFGVQSLVLQNIKIGNNTKIGFASIIIRNTVDGFSYLGNPAKKMDGF